MSEISFEERASEAKKYVQAVQLSRKRTRQVLEAMDALVKRQLVAAAALEEVVQYPGAPTQMVRYYTDCVRRLQSFQAHEVDLFHAVWERDVSGPLEDLEVAARDAHAAAKRRRDARERFLKGSQRSNNPFASTVTPEKMRLRKEAYEESNDEFRTAYRALGDLRVQTVGMLQAHYFHDQYTLLRKAGEAMQLSAVPPPPPPTLHARDSRNGDNITSPAPALPLNAGTGTARPLRRGSSSSGPRNGDGLAGAFTEISTSEESGDTSSSSSSDSSLDTSSSNILHSDGGSDSDSGSGSSSASASRTHSSASYRGGDGDDISGGSLPPPTTSETRLPVMRIPTPTKPHASSSGIRTSGYGSSDFLTAVATDADGEAPAAAAPAPVQGIPILESQSPYHEFAYLPRPGAPRRGSGAAPPPPLNTANFLPSPNRRSLSDSNGSPAAEASTARGPPRRAGDPRSGSTTHRSQLPSTDSRGRQFPEDNGAAPAAAGGGMQVHPPDGPPRGAQRRRSLNSTASSGDAQGAGSPHAGPGHRRPASAPRSAPNGPQYGRRMVRPRPAARSGGPQHPNINGSATNKQFHRGDWKSSKNNNNNDNNSNNANNNSSNSIGNETASGNSGSSIVDGIVGSGSGSSNGVSMRRGDSTAAYSQIDFFGNPTSGSRIALGTSAAGGGSGEALRVEASAPNLYGAGSFLGDEAEAGGPAAGAPLASSLGGDAPGSGVPYYSMYSSPALRRGDGGGGGAPRSGAGAGGDPPSRQSSGRVEFRDGEYSLDF